LSGVPRNGVGSAEDLHASAVRLTGLDDFGADEYQDGLAVLLESYARDADLTELGQRMCRNVLRGMLVARLFSEAAWRQHPQYTAVGIDKPIVITGLSRTGSTALHRLLAADPAHQGLEVWLARVPQPRPPRETWAANPVFEGIQAFYARYNAEHAGFAGVHYMAADQIEECWHLQCQSMRSVSFEWLAYLPLYSSWLDGEDLTGAYRRHRRNLQLIGQPDARRRWVLKDPCHLFALEALLAVYPDALVIQTHRAPQVAIASMCSLTARVTQGWSNTFNGEVIGRDQLELWARGLERFMAVRARHDPARFCDVQYDDFVTDPIGTIESVYGYFGLHLSGAAADAMRTSWAGRPAREAAPPHSYRMADFGLSAGLIDERFAAYLQSLPRRR
jgi:hypothetical protein